MAFHGVSLDRKVFKAFPHSCSVSRALELRHYRRTEFQFPITLVWCGERLFQELNAMEG